MYTLTIQNLVENNVNIFDFDYPFYKEEMKKDFEQHFIDYFLLDEIGLETVSLFKHRLKVKLNLIMPYYNEIFMTQDLEQRILDNYDVVEKYNSNLNSVSDNENSSLSRDLYKDTPKTKIDIDNLDVVTNINKNISEGKGKANTKHTEQWERTMTGNIGIQTDANAITSYWTSLRRVEQEIFEELSVLFMGVY